MTHISNNCRNATTSLIMAMTCVEHILQAQRNLAAGLHSVVTAAAALAQRSSGEAPDINSIAAANATAAPSALAALALSSDSEPASDAAAAAARAAAAAAAAVAASSDAAAGGGAADAAATATPAAADSTSPRSSQLPPGTESAAHTDLPPSETAEVRSPRSEAADAAGVGRPVPSTHSAAHASPDLDQRASETSPSDGVLAEPPVGAHRNAPLPAPAALLAPVASAAESSAPALGDPAAHAPAAALDGGGAHGHGGAVAVSGGHPALESASALAADSGAGAAGAGGQQQGSSIIVADVGGDAPPPQAASIYQGSVATDMSNGVQGVQGGGAAAGGGDANAHENGAAALASGVAETAVESAQRPGGVQGDAGGARAGGFGGYQAPSLSVARTADEETFHKVGAACDVIAALSADDNGAVHFTDWSVAFDRWVSTGAGRKLSTLNALVHVFLNGRLVPRVYMRVGADGMCAFPDGTRRPPHGAFQGPLSVPEGGRARAPPARQAAGDAVFGSGGGDGAANGAAAGGHGRVRNSAGDGGGEAPLQAAAGGVEGQRAVREGGGVRRGSSSGGAAEECGEMAEEECEGGDGEARPVRGGGGSSAQGGGAGGAGGRGAGAGEGQLLRGVNTLRFEARVRGDPRVLVADCLAFAMDAAAARVVVVDIDGTITRSDAHGLLMTLRLLMMLRPGTVDHLQPGVYSLLHHVAAEEKKKRRPRTVDHLQPGVCSLLHHVAAEGAQLLYLTARPLAMAPRTRAFLVGATQDGLVLPLGPLVTNLCKDGLVLPLGPLVTNSCRDALMLPLGPLVTNSCKARERGLTDVVYRELIARDMHRFKGQVLQDVAAVFRSAGRHARSRVFAAGVGNRLTDALAYQGAGGTPFRDALAYQMAGIPDEFICIIDPKTAIRTWSVPTGLAQLQWRGEATCQYASYHDSRFFELMRASLAHAGLLPPDQAAAATADAAHNCNCDAPA
ncbi:hypothetical protein JKP88DRAFT_295192 [Tribonema minus]|uniref:LNS2/PITP domain-containing protein n=1 Tax=Tribonema minus TaxID=303371 RepID=A0A835ZF08_9STRA|nr:hypothetical protein JKP88DRAFT_295192 [Tribonema minus]